MTDPYAVLGVSPTASQGEIVRAYRRQLRRYHPDMPVNARPGADDQLRHVLAAYALLRDPRRRAEFDRAAARPDRGSVRITSNTDDAGDQPPLWAGPVRRHR